jgi:hypothetical protein
MTGQCKKTIFKEKNVSHVHVNQSSGCLIQLLGSGGGGIEHLLPHGLLEVPVDEGESSTNRLVASIKVYGFFLAKAKIKID